MDNNIILNQIKQSFNNRIQFRERGIGIYQLIAPFYHEDGDMYDIFIDINPTSSLIRICDHGLTLMRLSYSYELDTPKKKEIYSQILSDNGVEEDNGNLFIDTLPENAYYCILKFSIVVSKITNMQLYRREVIKSLFYEDLNELVLSEYAKYNIIPKYLPLKEREDLEVDYCFDVPQKKLFLFGVKDNFKARLVTISCLEYMRNNVAFRSIIIHEDINALSDKDRSIITNVADKQFSNLVDFRASGSQYFLRELVS